MSVVSRLLRGEPLDLVARDTNVSVAKPTMSQTLSPSFARRYGLARVAGVWKVSRAGVCCVSCANKSQSA